MTGKIRKLLLKGRKGIKRCKKYGANYYRKNLTNHNFWRENDLTRKGRKLEGRISAVTAF